MLAYSGGLDTSVAIPWLAEKYAAEVIAVTLDLGQGRELNEVRERALAVGAVRAHVLDVRDEFARDYILPALQAGALYEERYPLATALGRPLIAQKLVEIARMEGADRHRARLHRQGQRAGCASSSACARSTRRSRVIAPARDLGHVARRRTIAYAQARRHAGSHRRSTAPTAGDANLWGRSIECGVLEDPWQEPPEDIYALTRAPRDCPDEPAYVEIEFEQGRAACARTASTMPLVELIESLETIAGAHGVGRIDMVENRAVGHQVARNLRGAGRPSCCTRRTASWRSWSSRAISSGWRSDLGREYADLVYNGLWFSPTREAIDAFVAQDAAARHRRGAPEAVQGRLPRRRPKVADA